MKQGKTDRNRSRVYAVSGGPDSVFLMHLLPPGPQDRIAHYNHGARGTDSDGDEAFCRNLAEDLGVRIVVGRVNRKAPAGKPGRRSGFELRSRLARHKFLRSVGAECGAGEILFGHTADDQVETILMRIFEGAGIAGLKGIPRETAEGLNRPILDVWREDIIRYLKKNRISWRADRTNDDTRFERNWIRHILIPLLVKRYGSAVKKRIRVLGERFREIDSYLDLEAVAWLGKHMEKSLTLPREKYRPLPRMLRIRILQTLCHRHLDLVPNERLLSAMDRLMSVEDPSGRLDLGRGWQVRCRYGDAIFVAGGGGAKIGRRKAPAEPRGLSEGGVPALLSTAPKGGISPAGARRLARGEQAGVFDADELAYPLKVRPLRPGDRIQSFGLTSEKKVKEILIDRKVPREERWGRPVVCDANGTILWIPGVARSAHAPVTSRTRRSVVLRIEE